MSAAIFSAQPQGQGLQLTEPMLALVQGSEAIGQQMLPNMSSSPLKVTISAGAAPQNSQEQQA